jgi:dihydropteroate synthase
MIWQTGRFAIDLTMPKIMGIVNLTPDSFSDGGRFTSDAQAIAFAEQLLADGADVLDLGAESTRPGSTPITAGEELARLAPVLREAVRWGVPVSIDTYKPIVMQTALDMGADIINDVWALRKEGAVDVVAKHATCGVCIMHMSGEPTTMQLMPMQTDRAGGVVTVVKDFLSERSQILNKAKVTKNRIVWDVGIGFGKTPKQNFELLAKQSAFLPSGYPLLCAWSRKSSLGKLLGQGRHDEANYSAAGRMVTSVTAMLLGVERGARLVRVHDVRETKEALLVWAAAKKQFD